MGEFLFVLISFAVVVIFLVLADRRMERRGQQKQAQEQAREKERKQLEQEQARSRLAKVEAIVQELVRTGDTATFERLLEFLRSEDIEELRIAAVKGLGQQFKSGHAPAFNALLDLLQSPDPNLYVDDRAEMFRRRRLAALAARKLGEIGDTRAIEPLRRQLLAHEPESQLYKQTTEALEQMIKPGDERAVQVLWGPVATSPIEDEPDKHLSLSQVNALGRFGDARAVGSLVAHARQWSGEECSRYFREDGVSCYTCSSSAAVKALEEILERDAANASEKALWRVLDLDGLTSQSLPDSVHDSYRDLRQPIDCHTVHRLARHELQRRAG